MSTTIGRKFGNGKDWYPNLMSAIMNRQMQKGSTISKSLPELLAYVSVVKNRYERRYGNGGTDKKAFATDASPRPLESALQ